GRASGSRSGCWWRMPSPAPSSPRSVPRSARPSSAAAVPVRAGPLSRSPEPWLLRLRGFRRMSRREAARVMPLLEAEAADLGVASLPLVLMADGDDLRVRAYARHLVIGHSLLSDEIGDGPASDAALDAVL